MTHAPTPQTQLPLPLVTVLPYLGDDTGCHIWSLTDAHFDPYKPYLDPALDLIEAQYVWMVQ